MEFLSLKGGCTGSAESTLVKIPHCWKPHVMAQLCITKLLFISELHLQEDVAGATFMAAGSSAPEFFTSVIGKAYV